MRNKALLVAFIACLLYPVGLYAQSVLYAPVAGNPATIHMEVLGKAGNFYWIQKSKKHNSFKKRTFDTDGAFEVYDARLNRAATIPYSIPDTVLKQYFVAGDRYFDQLLFATTADKTRVLLNRFSPEGTLLSHNSTLLDFPNSMKGNDFLLLRSQDKRNVLLLGFEPITDATPRMHAILYNSNWQVVSHTFHQDGNLTQPFLQYDAVHYPLEHFDNSPVKLANNGDWLMVAPSRRNNNYVLFHFQDTGRRFIQTEIKLTQNPRVQNVSLALDDASEEAIAGLLLYTGTPSVKKVRIAQYAISEHRFERDTTYRFHTLAAGKTREEHLYEQYFMPVPGKGFLFLKEYGRPYRSPYPLEEERTTDDDEEASNAAINAVPAAFNKDDYTRYGHLSGLRRDYERGDLNLYYFPATRQDSCWSGIINKAQTSELNTSFLSYACVPLGDRIVFLYNSALYNTAKYSSTTVLDGAGHPLNEGVVFWRPNNILDFQKGRQIAARELAVPYERNNGLGFAIIRL